MRKNRAIDDNNLHRARIVSATLSDLAFDHFEARYKPMRFAHELLARAASVSPSAARNWMRRICSPQTDNIGELLRNDAEFRAKVLAWIEGLE